MGPDERVDANLLAAYAEGRLTGERRARVEALLAVDPEAREIVASLAEDDDVHAAPLRLVPRRVPWRTAALAAAGLLVGVALALWAPWKTTGQSLEEVAARLAAQRPDLFAGFRPLDARELEAGGLSALRGGVVVVRPRGVVLDRPSTIEWRPVAGASQYRLAILSSTGEPLETITSAGTSHPWPIDLPVAWGHSYLVEVATEGAFGHAEGRASFRVRTAEEAAAWARATDEVRARVDADVAHLLVAHLALRRGLLEEAERAARAHIASSPDDARGRAVLEHVERAVGAH
jgi:hypothetical protein